MSEIKAQLRSAFSVLVVALVVSSVVAPAAFAGTASAVNKDDADSCGWRDPLEYLAGTTCDWHSEYDDVNSSSSRDDAYVQADHHAELRGEYETAEQFRTVFDNYGQDTGTIASLAARNAIVTAYNNGSSASTADAKAQQAIEDYYSKKQINTLEAFSKQQAQIAFAVNSTRNHPDTLNDFVYHQGVTTGGSQSSYKWYYTGELVTRTYTLANGSTHQYHSAEVYVQATDSNGNVYSTSRGLGIDEYQNSTEAVVHPRSSADVFFPGLLNVRASYAGTTLNISDGHPAQVIADYDSWASTMTMWQDQSKTVKSNYQTGTASDLYQAMDTGSLDPADVRGAEGQVRYLSGDSNSTTQRYKAALYGTLDMNQAGFNSTFYVEYTGYTNATYNRSKTDGSRTLEYSGYVENQTYQGMVFSSEVPTGGFQPGGTYDTSKLNGTTMIYSQSNGTVTFVKGNITISKITDQDGNKVSNATWEQPKYDTNDVSEYIDYLNKTQQMQLQLLERYGDTTSSGSTSSDTSSGWNPTQSQLVFMLLAVASMAAISKRGAE